MNINATKTSALQSRILSQESQAIDLNRWIFDKLDIKTDPTILELCCGTGAQTKYLSKIAGAGVLNCVDINEETIATNRSVVADENINYHMSDIDLVDNYLSESLDLIFSSYGFYYSRSPVELHKKLYKKLNSNGKFVLVGPVLGNNSQLYEILRRINVDVNNDVMYSSEEFMLEMEEVFLKYYGNVCFYRSLNNIRYNSITDLLNYWKNTTFFNVDKEKDFVLEATKYYSDNDIVVTKSIAYLEGVL